jgi:C-lobe and N-lobe beta barrels of Tf-binding protein B
MKRETKWVAVVMAAAILAGCASGGGARQSGDSGIDEFLFAVGCAIPLGWSQACSERFGDSSTTYSPSTTPAQYGITSWADLPADTLAVVYGPRVLVMYEGRIASVMPESTSLADDLGVKYDAQKNLVDFTDGDMPYANRFMNLSGVGHPELDVGVDTDLSQFPQTPFTSVTANSVGSVANPYVAGWEYQSFGVWNNQDITGEQGWVGAHSFGNRTADAAVPLSGTASFVGKLGGLYVSPAGEGSVAAGDVTVNADFSARSLSLASSNTVTTRDLATATPAPGLDMSGTLKYSAGSGRFSGALSSAGGKMSGTSNGQFYGPNAEELGGVFVVKSPTTVETFTGAYGARR